MADGGLRRGEHARRLRGRHAYSREEIASRLVPRRDRLVDQLPRELAAARGLSRDEHELIVDEAIDYLVTEYTVPIETPESLERAFWGVAGLRVRRANDGRAATVRAGWRRVDVDGFEVPSFAAEPESAAIRRDEREALLEFAATLTLRERQVLACKYAGTKRVLGRVVVARSLGLPIGEVRKAEASINRKMERFVAIMAAGSLCTHREPLLAALAVGTLSAEQAHVARLHLRHCAACRVDYVARLRALHSGQLPRDVAALLPIPQLADESRRPRGFWDVLTDWASRPLAHDATVTGSQVAVGRGIGAAAAAKLAALCIGGATVLGGGVLCLSSTSLLGGSHGPRQAAAPAQRPHHARHKQRPHRRDAQPPTATRSRAAATPTPTPTPHRRPVVKSHAASVAPAAHERQSATSPAPAGSAPGGASEFGPTSAQAPSQPAAAVTGGGAEFP